MINRFPNNLTVIYIGFLKNYAMTSKALENYYTDPTSAKRAKLIQEFARMLKGTLSQRIIMAETAIPMLDKYNTIIDITDTKWVDVDFGDPELLTILGKAGKVMTK